MPGYGDSDYHPPDMGNCGTQSDYNPHKYHPTAKSKSVSGEEFSIDERREVIEVEEGRLMSHVIMTQKIKTQ